MHPWFSLVVNGTTRLKTINTYDDKLKRKGERLNRSKELVWTLVSLEGFEDWIWNSRFEVSFHSALDSGLLLNQVALVDLRDSGLLDSWTLTHWILRLQTLASHPYPHESLPFQGRMEFYLTQHQLWLAPCTLSLSSCPPLSRSRRELVPPLQGFLDNCPLQEEVQDFIGWSG